MEHADTAPIEIKLVGDTSTQITKIIVEVIAILTCCGLPVLLSARVSNPTDSSKNFYGVLWLVGAVFFILGLFTFSDFLKANRLDRDGIQVIVPLEDAWDGLVRSPGSDRGASVKAWFLRYKLPDGSLYQTTVPEKLFKQVVAQNKLAVIYWPDNPEIQRIEC